MNDQCNFVLDNKCDGHKRILEQVLDFDISPSNANVLHLLDRTEVNRSWIVQ